MPIFVGGELVGFSANKAHWTEVGGKDPGSWTTDSVDIWQEGLAVSLRQAFQPRRAEPCAVRRHRGQCPHAGDDARRRLGAGRLLSTRGARFQELCQRHGVPIVRQTVDALLDYGEAMTARELASCRSGVYEAEDWIDDDGLSSDPIFCKVKVTVADGAFICDFTGTAPETRGPSIAPGPGSTPRCGWSSKP